jgi:hypothetical protein
VEEIQRILEEMLKTYTKLLSDCNSGIKEVEEGLSAVKGPGGEETPSP